MVMLVVVITSLILASTGVAQQSLQQISGGHRMEQVGVFIELSRKVPWGHENPSFDTMGDGLLSSVKFSEFRVDAEE